MYKSIVVPVDLGHEERAKPMIELAKRLGEKGTRITLVNVVEDIPTYVAAELPGGIIDKAKQKAREALEKIAKSNDLDAGAIEVKSGQAATSILGIAEQKKADLIIIASHQPGLQDYFLGSTAARVVRHAKCTVLVMR